MKEKLIRKILQEVKNQSILENKYVDLNKVLLDLCCLDEEELKVMVIKLDLI